MNTSLKKSFIIAFILLSFAGLLVLLAEIIQSRTHSTPEDYAVNAQKKLRVLEEKMVASLENVAAITNDSIFHKYFIHQGFQELGFSFFYFENEIITKWSDNETEINSEIADTCESNTLIHLNNGWYELFIHHVEGKEVIGLLLICKEYAYENQYLVNEFNPELNLPAESELAGTNGENSFVIRSIKDQPLFAIRFQNGPIESSGFNAFSWLYLFSFVLFLFAFFFAAKALSQFSSWLLFLIIVLLVAARAWMIHARLPAEFYTTSFFSPQLYASSFYFNSLGDLFINALIGLSLSGMIYHFFKNKKFQPRKKAFASFVNTGSLTILFLLSLPLDNLVRGLVLNSKISFDISNIFSLNEYSLSGMVVIAVLLCSYFLISLSLFRFISTGIDRKSLYLHVVVSFSFFTIIFLFASPRDWSSMYSPLLLALTIAFLIALMMKRQNKGNSLRLNFLLGITLLFSVYASLMVWNMNNKKEKENRKLLAQKIESGQDQIAEYLFEELEPKIRTDKIILELFKGAMHVQELASKRLMQFYFTGYWSKFNISISCYDRFGMPLDSMQSGLPIESLKRTMAWKGNLNDLSQIHFFRNESGQQQYLAFIPVAHNNQKDSLIGTIGVTFVPKLFQTGEGLPELFVSNKVSFMNELNNYSFARYKNDSLLNQSGVFAYYLSLGHFQPLPDDYSFIELDNYNHLVHKVNDASVVVVSKPGESLLILFTLFSYLFSLFSLMLLFCYVFWQIVSQKISFHFNLTRRIQFSVMTLVIVSFVLTGSGTMYYMVHKYDMNNDRSINEKTSSLIAVMEKELAESISLKPKLSDETEGLLNRLAETAKTDFNIYTLSGDLYYSSQPKIFDQGILSRKINPDALFEISEKGKTQFVHPESIGKLNYIAAYEPLRNREGKQFGFLHLPYFEKQKELNKEISNFLSALINIYMLLFACALLVAFFISSRITYPLLLIQEKLKSIRLGKRNELIEYRQRDEIGELVREYNRMVNELTDSAEKLARSERESAWREMAKQVAHEIKNPLTPMKLSLQHLQRAWEEKSHDLPEIFQRISQTLVQQIDTLSGIATEFSNFAQMPPAKKEMVDLVKVLDLCVDLFNEEADITLFVAEEEKGKFVLADKNQLIRVFSNLLKNACQAVPPGQQSIIQIHATTSNNHYMVSVQDNGVGISPDQMTKIFTPSFTTKSGGMGLGLSIVKSIVESSGGTIWFESENHQGTTFYISLPIIQ